MGEIILSIFIGLCLVTMGYILIVNLNVEQKKINLDTEKN